MHFVPVHMFSFYQENDFVKGANLPVTEKTFEGIISIPLYPSMNESDVEYVAEAIREIAKKHHN